MQPEYKVERFLEDCGGGMKKAYVSKDALITAKLDFNLSTPERVLRFINKGGLEELNFINSKVWEKNPNAATIKIMIDAYSFYSGCYMYGYIAFYFQPLAQKWVVKSFKRNTNPDLRNLVFKEQISGLMN